MIDFRSPAPWLAGAGVAVMSFVVVSVVRWFSPALFGELVGPVALAGAAIATLVALGLHNAQD